MKLFLSLALVLSALACKRVTTIDGTIPAEYLTLAQRYEGSYRGDFEDKKGTLTLKLEGNRPFLTFIGEDGTHEMLIDHCESQIQDLVAITPEKSNKDIKVDSAEFSFSGGRCHLFSKILFLDFRHRGLNPYKISVSIHNGYETQWRTICSVDHTGQQYCHEEPESVPIYFSGTFTR